MEPFGGSARRAGGAALRLVPGAPRNFAGRIFVVVVINAFMGLPPVVVGLAVYLLLSRSGPSALSASCSRRAR